MHDEKKKKPSKAETRCTTYSKTSLLCVCMYGEPTRRTPMTLADLVREGFPELRRNVHGDCITPLAPRNPKPSEPARNIRQGQGHTGERVAFQE